MKRILVFIGLATALVFAAPTVANAVVPGLPTEGVCVQPGAHFQGNVVNGRLTGYRFVQDSDTTYGVIGTVTGSCPVLDAGGYPTGELTTFTVEQVQSTGGTVYLDCFNHTFSFSSHNGQGVSATGVTVYVFYLNGTLTGITPKQHKAICSTKDRLAKNPPTDVKSTAEHVRALNDLLSAF